MASGGPALISTAVCEAASATMVGATLMRGSRPLGEHLGSEGKRGCHGRQRGQCKGAFPS